MDLMLRSDVFLKSACILFSLTPNNQVSDEIQITTIMGYTILGLKSELFCKRVRFSYKKEVDLTFGTSESFGR